jgi:uncharacterized protein (TIRG00374 family)
MKRGFRSYLLILRIAVPVVLFAYIFRRVDWLQLRHVATEVDGRWLGFALLLQLLAIFLQGGRYYLLMRRPGDPTPFWRLQLVNFIAMFFDLFTPGRLGSDAYRVLVLRGHYDTYHMISVLVVLRLQGLLITAVLAGVVGLSIYGAQDWRTLAALGSLLAALLGVFVIATVLRMEPAWLARAATRGTLFGRVVEKLLTLRTALRTIRLYTPSALAAAALAVPFVVVTAAIVHVVAHAFGLELTFSRYLFGTALIMLVSVLPITIHGRGIAEVVAIAVWHEPGATVEQILAVMVTAYVIMLLCSLLAGCCWLLVRPCGARTAGPESAAR